MTKPTLELNNKTFSLSPLPEQMPKELSKELDELKKEASIKKNSSLKRIQRLIKKYPKISWPYRILVYHLERKSSPRLEDTLHEFLDKFPQDIYANTVYCSYILETNPFNDIEESRKEILELCGEDFDPNYISYGKQEFDLNDYVRLKMLGFRFYLKFYDYDKAKRIYNEAISVTYGKTIYTKQTLKKEFEHRFYLSRIAYRSEEITKEVLFSRAETNRNVFSSFKGLIEKKDFLTETEIANLRKLPRTELIEDISHLLQLSDKYINECHPAQIKSFFFTFQLMLLAIDLRSSESLGAIFKFLTKNYNKLQIYYSGLLDEVIKRVSLLVDNSTVEITKGFLSNENILPSPRVFLAVGLAELSLLNPSKSMMVKEIFSSVLDNALIKGRNNDSFLDRDFLRQFTIILSRHRFSEFIFKIGELFENNLVEKREFYSFKKIEQEISSTLSSLPPSSEEDYITFVKRIRSRLH